MIFLALVTFEHDGDCLPMAIDADEAEEAVEMLRKSLAADRLKLVEAERVHAVDSAQQAELLDDHLANNMREWEPGRRAVWGTIHCYIGDRYA